MTKMAILCLAVLALTASGVQGKSKEFTESFRLEDCTFASRGSNPWFSLVPGHRLVLENAPKKSEDKVVLTITVLDDTEQVAGVTTRVVEERETEGGVLKEVSRNFFAICEQTNTVFYFGEDVDNYDETGTTVINHDGAWRAGVGDARPGVIMPGIALIGSRYFQEVAPEVALDRAEVTSTTATVETPAGNFSGCLVTKETSALEKGRSIKAYAPGIGLIRDDDLLLTSVQD